MKTIFKIGIFGGLLIGAYKLFGMKRVSDKIVTALSNPRVHKVDLKGIAIRTEINVSNPTKSTMKITKPVVTLTTNGKYITSTAPENKEFTINSLTDTKIDTIEIVVPWTILAGYIYGIFGKIPQILAAFKAKDMKALGEALAIPLEMKYSLYANGLSYESEPTKIL
ncbi:MAG: hypothetical protein HY951_07035 [Bacteroidia bacterium]|nr:hypothetical protein [Bacteroidia bacterium]